MSPILPSPYRGQVVSMGTMHGKQNQFQPAFLRWHDATVHATRHVDTDAFGTFTGETPRTLTAVDAAIAKAEAAMRESGSALALATEASYATAAAGLGPVVHEEIAVFVDERRNIRIVERVRSYARVLAPRTVHGAGEAQRYLTAVGFPGQGVILRLHDDSVIKGLTSWDDIRAHLNGQPVTIEADLRAHHNPIRRRALRRISWMLAARLCTTCPACATPGFGNTDVVMGLPCATCGAPTRTVRADVKSCASCDHRVVERRPVAVADPGTCDECNP